MGRWKQPQRPRRQGLARSGGGDVDSQGAVVAWEQPRRPRLQGLTRSSPAVSPAGVLRRRGARAHGPAQACRSACEAFGRPEYCCSGDYGNPDTCRPSVYSQMFKTACPRSYSYAYDDATSTFTCTATDYSITFCPPRAGTPNR